MNKRRIVLITGGSRSGKSDYALRMGEALSGPRTFVATCPKVDPEMDERIQVHRERRDPTLWQTLEEERDLVGVVRRCRTHPVILIDCLTLWINNLTFRNDTEVDETDMEARTEALLAACRTQEGTLILVGNELGMGIVPCDPVTRRFRDLVGRCHQCLAQHADDVLFMVSGLPLQLKGSS